MLRYPVYIDLPTYPNFIEEPIKCLYNNSKYITPNQQKSNVYTIYTFQFRIYKSSHAWPAEPPYASIRKVNMISDGDDRHFNSGS